MISKLQSVDVFFMLELEWALVKANHEIQQQSLDVCDISRELRQECLYYTQLFATERYRLEEFVNAVVDEVLDNKSEVISKSRIEMFLFEVDVCEVFIGDFLDE